MFLIEKRCSIPFIRRHVNLKLKFSICGLHMLDSVLCIIYRLRHFAYILPGTVVTRDSRVWPLTSQSTTTGKVPTSSETFRTLTENSLCLTWPFLSRQLQDGKLRERYDSLKK